MTPVEAPMAQGPGRASGAGPLPRYALAVAVTLLAFALKLALGRYLGPPYILFYPAVMVVALLAGLGPGLVATALAAALAVVWLLPVPPPVVASRLRDLTGLTAFAAMGLLMSAVADRYRRARDRVAQQELERAVQQSEARARAAQDAALHRYELLAANSRDIFLLSRVSDGRILEANAAASRAYGFTRDELLARTLQDLLAPGAPGPERPHGAGAEGGLLETLHRRKDGTPFPVEVSAEQAAIDGTPTQVNVVRDISGRLRAGDEARDAARRQAYLATLSDTLRPIADPGEVQRRAAQLLGEHLGASRVHYAEVVEGGKFGVVRGDYSAGLPSVVGRHRFDDYGPAVMNEFRAGRTLVVSDVPNDPRLSPQERAATAALSVGAYLIVPLIKRGQPVAVLVAHQSAPRAWTPYEVELIAETAERTWSAVERAHAEAALRESEARYRATVEQAAVGFALVETATGRFLQVNGRLAEMLGYTREEVLATTWQALTHEDDVRASEEGVQRMRASGEPVHTEKRYRRKDGSILWAGLTISPVAILGAHSTTQIAVVQDISERKQAEQALRRSEERLRAAQSVAHVGSWAWYCQTGKLDWSDEMYRIFGLEKSTFTGDLAEVVARAIHPDDRAAVNQSNETVLREGKPTPLEYRIRHADGTTRTVWAEAGALQRDAAGRPEILTGIVHDITERKRAEEERVRLEAQLHQARKMESVGRLAGGIAHDFNNMLGVILGHSDLALGQLEMTEPLRADLEEVRRAARRSADLTRQLLAFARKQTIQPVVLDLNATVGGMLKMLQRLLGEHIQLTWRPDGALWPVKMDPSQIDQILANLCVNARDAIEQAGRLTIETGNATLDEAACRDKPEVAPGNYVRLLVSDDGCGMDQETLAQLFEPFFTTKAPGKGTGLGLATIYGIVKQNGGFLSVASAPGEGTSFSIYLPRHVGQPGEAGAGEAAAPGGRGHETVLVVEDEAAMLRVTRRMLEGLGYQVLAATSPEAALRLVEAHPSRVHLLLTDVVMPGMNGRDLSKNLQARHPKLKRLFMSGYTADVIAHQGVLAEGVTFLQKPFTPDQLGAAVRRALDAEG